MGVVEAPTSMAQGNFQFIVTAGLAKENFFALPDIQGPGLSWGQLPAKELRNSTWGRGSFITQTPNPATGQFLKKQGSFTSFSSFKLGSNTWKAKLSWLYRWIWDKPALAQCPSFSTYYYLVLFIFSSSSCIPACVLVPKMLNHNKIQSHSSCCL